GKQMNELIPTQQSNDNEILVTGRDLHEFLEVNEKYTEWINRMIEYGFSENEDYQSVREKVQSEKRERNYRMINHHIKIDMAKEISMLQRNEKGKQARQYFIEVEKKWNSPEMIVQRAMEIQKKKVELLESENAELKPKATYHDLVLQSNTLLTATQIAKDLGIGAPTLNKKLNELGVQYKKGHRWYLYHKYQDKGYTQSKTFAVSADESKDHMYWTQKGKKFILDLLEEKEGIVPVTNVKELV